MLVLVTDMYNESVYININQVCIIKEETWKKLNGEEFSCYTVELGNGKRIYIPDREATHLIGAMHIR
jgi:hypothetical protein